MGPASFRRNRHGQRGAVAVLVALAIVAMLTATMLAIEVGRMYSAHRQLKKLAAMAALDGVRAASGCSADVNAGPATQGDINDAVRDSLTKNGYGSLYDAAVIEPGLTRVHRDGDQDGLRDLEPTAPDQAQAVRVKLSRPFPTPFLPFFTAPGQLMAATATAEQTALGSFYLGSGLLSVDGGILNALLSGLLGGNVTLNVVDYQRLAAVGVSAEALALAVGLDAQDLSDPLALAAQTPVLSDTIDGLADSLSDVDPVVVDLLEDLAHEARKGADSTVPLARLLQEVDPETTEAPFVNLLDLLIGLGAAASADPDGEVAPIALPVAAAIPGVTELRTFVRILQPPQFSGLARPGEAVARTAQVQLQLRLQVDAVSNIASVVNVLLLGLAQVKADPLNLGLDVEVARATATLDRIQCPRSADPTVAAALSAQPSVASLQLGTYSGDPEDAPAISNGVQQLLGVELKILGGLVAKIPINVFLQAPVSTTVGNTTPIALEPVTEFERRETDSGVPYFLAESPVDDMNPQTVGSTNLLGSAVASLFADLDLTASDPTRPNESTQVCILLFVCIPIGSIADAVLDPVVDLLGTVLASTGTLVDGILDPLLEALGVRLGSATVTMATVSIDQPHLVSMDPVTAGE